MQASPPSTLVHAAYTVASLAVGIFGVAGESVAAGPGQWGVAQSPGWDAGVRLVSREWWLMSGWVLIIQSTRSISKPAAKPLPPPTQPWSICSPHRQASG